MQRGFSVIYFVLIVLLLILVLGGGYILYSKSLNNPSPSIQPKALDKVKDRQEDAVFCTQDAKQCPDGSYVSRSGPKCEFAPCP